MGVHASAGNRPPPAGTLAAKSLAMAWARARYALFPVRVEASVSDSAHFMLRKSRRHDALPNRSMPQ